MRLTPRVGSTPTPGTTNKRTKLEKTKCNLLLIKANPFHKICVRFFLILRLGICLTQKRQLYILAQIYMKKFTAVLTSILVVAAIATTAIPVAAAETVETENSNKPPLTEEMIQHREEMAQKIADLLGIDVETLKEEREAGKNLMEIAEEYDASDAVLQELKEMRKEMNGKKNRNHKTRLPKEALEKVAEAMDISAEELIEQLKDGTKLKDLAEEYGIDLKEFAPLKKGTAQTNDQYDALTSQALVN